MSSLAYVVVPSPFGPLVILWQDTPAGPRVQRVLLPQEGTPSEAALQAIKEIGPAVARPFMTGLAEQITHFLEGEALSFPLDLLALDICSDFQQRVLRAEHAIPRGRVSTYGRIARHLGQAGGARAVGRALATHPFPILIPCHRAIRSDGALGGYQGGPAMKQALLEMEGLTISPAGKVLVDKLYY
jgi:methylated-DNA-[protein]-cysteine S-methyltransferase